MTRLDWESGNLVGAGEDAAFAILKYLTGLPYRTHKQWNLQLPGVYRQIPVDWLIPKEEFDILSPEQQKKSIDLLILYLPEGFNASRGPIYIIVRVQGKKGDLKLKRDGVQADIILKKYSIVDLHKRECKNLFKERVDERAIQEVRDAFKTYRVEIPDFRKS